MRVSRRFLQSSFFVANSFLIPQAWAADFYGKAPPYAEPPPAYADWSGPFAYGTVGYGWMTGNTGFNGTDNIPGGTGSFVTLANTVGLPLGFNLSDGSIQGGGGIGIDKQFGQWIFEASTSWIFSGNGMAGGAAAPIDNIGDLIGINTQTTLNQYGTTELAVGYQFNKSVPLAGFLKVGVAYGDASHTDTIFATGPFINAVGGPFATQFNTTKTLFGPVVGAKLEYMITRQWIAGIDYEHIFWGSFDADTPFLTGGIGQSHTNLALDTVRFDLKYLLPIF